MPAYYNAIAKGVSAVMVSYSSWNGRKMHANRDLVTGFLKNTLKFKGFVISDYKGIDRITSPPGSNYTYSVQAGVGAGIDMIMVHNNHADSIDNLTSLVNQKVIPMSRIDDVVRRILRVKFVMVTLMLKRFSTARPSSKVRLENLLKLKPKMDFTILQNDLRSKSRI